MKLKEIKDILDASILCGEDMLGSEVGRACGSDLMSDVLRYTEDDSILLTGLMNVHVLKTADLANIQCIVFVRNKVPIKDIIEEAKKLDLVIMCTELPMYLACGRLYNKGLGVE